MKILFSTIAIFLNYYLSAQHEFGAKIDGGMSRIITTGTNSDYKTHMKASWDGGLFYNYNFTKKSYIGIDLLISKFEGHQYFKGPQILSTFTVINTTNEYRKIHK